MTADDVRGEDYEAAKPTAIRTLVSGDPWKRHHDLCPVHQAPDRAAWCCCIALETAEQDALDRARAAVVEAYNDNGLLSIGHYLQAIDSLRADHA